MAEITGLTVMGFDRAGYRAYSQRTPTGLSSERAIDYNQVIFEMMRKRLDFPKFINRGFRAEFRGFYFMGSGIVPPNLSLLVVGAILIDQPTDPAEANKLSMFLSELTDSLGSFIAKDPYVRNHIAENLPRP